MLTVELFTFNPVQENTYVVYNGKRECCIIDPGCYFATEEMELAGFIEKNGLKPVLLLNTHCHFDHIFGNKFIHRKYGLELHIHRLEEQVLAFGEQSAQRFQISFDNYDGPLHFLEAGTSIKIGEDELEILFTPGHSPGSVSFYSKADGFVIAGDVLFQGSIGRTDLPGGNIDTLENSIRTQLYTLPEQVVVYPGHGDPTTIGREMETNPFFRR
jgi:hydroxyacylglutathione hydrolase